MGEPLYTPEILRLTLATAGFVRLENPQASAERRSPICGSRIVVDLSLDDQNHIAALGQEVRACALGQASAALLDHYVRGQSVDALVAARDALRTYLAGERNDPGNWPGLIVFAAARAHTARHPAIMLAFEAASAAALAAMES